MPPAQKVNVDATGLELRRVRNRELELKRITGEISCAECRRLKLKCDKKVPCASCVRRGCKQICPTGTSTGTSGRQIAINSASTSHTDGSDVTRKLTAMSERIRALEDALQIQSDSSHPLLSAELLAIKQGIDVIDPSSEETKDGEDEEELAGAFGTLSVSEGQTMRFLGASATESVLLMEVFDPASLPHSFDFSTLPPELAQASGMWPFTPAYLSRPEHFSQLVSHLPPYERVTSLIEAYFSNLAWFIAPIDRAQVVDDIIPIFYPQRRPISPGLVDAENMHDLALLFIVLACGAVADLTQPAVNTEAERYQQLARAALGLRSLLDFGSFAASQTLFLMGSYEVYSGRKTSQESSWKLMSIGMSLAASIGLHRDPSRWKLEAKMVNRRRRTFWEVNNIDKWKCLGSGRPSMFAAHVIDCEFPLDRGATVEDDGTVIESVWQWRYRFARDILPTLTQKICAARPPKYSEILEMDRLVRDFEVHPFVHRLPKSDYSLATDGEYGNLHPLVSLWWREMALLYVHRNCFARAILEYPSDPMRSPFAPSFLAAYRSSTTILKIVSDAFDRMSLILADVPDRERMWPLWAMSLSCAVIVGTVASRVSTVNFAASALNELEKAVIVFEKASNHPVARYGVTLLYRLRDKANAAFHAHDSQSLASTNVADPGKRSATQLQVYGFPRAPGEVENNEEELNIMRGTTRYIEQRSISSNLSVQESFAQIYLTYGDSSSSASAPSSAIDSSSVASGSASAVASSPGNIRPSNSAANGGSGSNAFGPTGMDYLLSPSSLVQTLPESKTQENTNGSKAPPTLYKSPGTTQNHPCAYDNYLPPFVESASQNPDRARAWLKDVERDRAAAISAQFGGQQQQHPMHPSQSHPSQSRNQESTAPSPFSGTQGPSTPLDFSIENSHAGPDGREPSGASFASDDFSARYADAFTPFDFTLDSTGAAHTFFTGSASEPHVVADLNALYQKEDGATAEAWHSFMQQFELTNAADAGYENWEAMAFP